MIEQRQHQRLSSVPFNIPPPISFDKNQTRRTNSYSSSGTINTMPTSPTQVPFGGEPETSSPSSAAASYYGNYHNANMDRRDDCSSTRRSSSYGSCSTGRVGDGGPPPPSFWVSDVAHQKSSSKTSTIERSIMQMVYFIAVLSWIAATYSSGKSHQLIHQLNRERSGHKLELEEQRNTWYTLRDELEGETAYVENLEKTRQALMHEKRLLAEFAESEFLLSPTPPKDDNGLGNTHMIDSWLEHRRYGLEHRLHQLQHYLQEFSRREVTERFGPGPHRVRFTVDTLVEETKNANSGKGDITSTAWRSVQREFVIELAPVSEMPHSIHFFLEMIQLKIWDNTVLVHAEKEDHVMTGIPIDFTSRQMKTHHLGYLGWKGLGFPEYSPNYANHEQYTIGFTKLFGPSFYINTVDNVKLHGLGGSDQREHLLEKDADPCFAKVVKGKDVVDDLIEFGLSGKKTNTVEEHPWAGTSGSGSGEHTVTRIIKVEMI